MQDFFMQWEDDVSKSEDIYLTYTCIKQIWYEPYARIFFMVLVIGADVPVGFSYNNNNKKLTVRYLFSSQQQTDSVSD